MSQNPSVSFRRTAPGAPISDRQLTKTQRAEHHATHKAAQKARRAKDKALVEKTKLEAKMPHILHVEPTDRISVDQALRKTRTRMRIKNEAIAALAEFCGTFLFLLMSLGIATIAGQQDLSVASTSTTAVATLDASQLLYSSLGFGFALAVSAWAFYRTSGSIFNPAILWGLFMCGAVTWYRFLILLPVQFIAAIAAAGVAEGLIPGGLNARSVLSQATSTAQGFFIEFFLTSLLMITVCMLAVEKHRMRALAPVGIGLALFVASLFGTPFTSASLNPARSLGPDVIAGTFEHTAWIYYTAPFAGSTLATGIYIILRWSSHEESGGGQDDHDVQLLIRNEEGRLTGYVETVQANEKARMDGDVPDVEGLFNPNVVDDGDSTLAPVVSRQSRLV